MAEELRNAQQEREKYVLAFNDTMLKIWREQITLLDVIDTGRLLRSPKSVAVRADGRFIEATLSQGFLNTDCGRTSAPERKSPEETPGI